MDFQFAVFKGLLPSTYHYYALSGTLSVVSLCGCLCVYFDPSSWSGGVSNTSCLHLTLSSVSLFSEAAGIAWVVVGTGKYFWISGSSWIQSDLVTNDRLNEVAMNKNFNQTMSLSKCLTNFLEGSDKANTVISQQKSVLKVMTMYMYCRLTLTYFSSQTSSLPLLNISWCHNYSMVAPTCQNLFRGNCCLNLASSISMANSSDCVLMIWEEDALWTHASWLTLCVALPSAATTPNDTLPWHWQKRFLG